MSGSTRKLRSSKKVKQETTSSSSSEQIIVIEAGDVDSTTEKFANDNQILSAILDANLPPKNDSGSEANTSNALSPELFCLDDVCSLQDEALSRPTSPENQTASECSMSLVVGEGPEVTTIRDLITKVTMGHEIQLCLQEEAFNVTNKQDFNIIWLQMSMPASQEILSLTTSIRYASKTNRNTVIIGFAAVVSMVDLRLHGIDEILVPPWTCHAVRDKYAKWTSVSLVSVDESGNISEEDKSRPTLSVSSSSTPINPATPSTPASATSDDTERSCFSGVESPPTVTAMSHSAIPTFATLRNLVPNLACTPVRPRHVHPNDHTTKEKLRRERIKDSCDQLRVLLPYVRGRKTDMASILEMCVEYLKIVNAALPQNFQNEIIDVLGRECKTPTGNKGRGRKCKKDSMAVESPSASAVTSTVEHDVNGNDQLSANNLYPFRPNQGSFADTDSAVKRELPKNFMDMQPSKRFRLQAAADGFITATPCPTNLAVATNINNPGAFETMKLPRQDQTNNTDDPLPVVYPFHALQAHAPMYSENDNANARLYSPHVVTDNYTPTNYFGPTIPPGKTGHERDSYGLFVDTNPLYHYYGGLHPSPLSQTYNNAPNCNNITGYVNPNSVLPMSHNGRLKTECEKADDQGDMSQSSSNEDDSTTKRELEC